MYPFSSHPLYTGMSRTTTGTSQESASSTTIPSVSSKLKNAKASAPQYASFSSCGSTYPANKILPGQLLSARFTSPRQVQGGASPSPATSDCCNSPAHSWTAQTYSRCIQKPILFPAFSSVHTMPCTILSVRSLSIPQVLPLR